MWIISSVLAALRPISRYLCIFDDACELLPVWRHRYLTRRQLRALDHRAREDVGIDSVMFRREASKWFWQS